MEHLIFIAVTLVILVGFFALTDYEMRRGERVFASERNKFDRYIERIMFIFNNVNIGLFIREEIKRIVGRFSHAVAYLSLQAVRAIERILTRLVRYLRARNVSDTASPENARDFVKTLSDFKDRLKATHPEISDIQ